MHKLENYRIPFACCAVARPKISLIVAIALLLIVESVFRTDFAWRLVPSSSVNELYEVPKAGLAYEKTPLIVFLGDSVVQNGIGPRIIEERLALETGNVVNFGMPGSTAFDFRTAYQKNRKVIKSAGRLYVGISPWNLQTVDYPADTRFMYSADLSDRLALSGTTERLSATIGWVWRTWGARYTLRGYLIEFARLRPRTFSSRSVSVDTYGRIEPWHRTNQSDLSIETMADTHMREISDEFVDPVAVQFIRDLITMSIEDNVELAFFEPLRNPYWEDVVHNKYFVQDKQWKMTFEQIFGYEVRFVEEGRNICQQWRECFGDWGHAIDRGVITYSIRLAALLENDDISAGEK